MSSTTRLDKQPTPCIEQAFGYRYLETSIQGLSTYLRSKIFVSTRVHGLEASSMSECRGTVTHKLPKKKVQRQAVIAAIKDIGIRQNFRN